MKRIFLLLAVIAVLIGCSSAYKENVAEAEAALEIGEFENALKYYNFALDEKTDSSEVKDMIALLNDYDTLQKKIENFEWTEAFDLANDILKNDAIVPSLQKEVKELLTTIEEEKEKEAQITSELKKIEKLINNDNVEKAYSELIELESKIKSNAFNSELDDLYNKLEMAEKRVAEKEEKEAEKKRLEEKTKQQATKEISLKEKYLQKADNLDNEIMNEAKKLFAHDLQPGFYGQYYSEWDNLLNEVWGELKTTMPKNAFEKLKSEQNEWIKMKEKNFDEHPDEIASARATGMDYLAFETKDRTYYLIKNYMD